MTNFAAQFKAPAAFSTRSLPRPEEAPGQKEFLSRPGPLAVEIGAGVGFHPLLHCRLSPDWRILAIERTRAKFEKMHRRWEGHHRPPQMLPIHSDGVWWVSHYLPAESVSRFYFLYPNPYPKARQANQRWPHNPFLQKVVECLKPNGEIVLATNLDFYRLEAENLIPHWHPQLKLQESRLWSMDLGPRTHFEKKYLLRGEPCFNLVFKKSS